MINIRDLDLFYLHANTNLANQRNKKYENCLRSAFASRKAKDIKTFTGKNNVSW